MSWNVTNTRVFEVPRERLFEAIAEPSQPSQWWGPNGFTNTFHEYDFRPGGLWHLTMHAPEGAAALNLDNMTGFDIPASVILTTANAPAVGSCYILGTSVGMSVLYEIDLTNAALTEVGVLGSATASGLVVWEAAKVLLAGDLVTVTAGPTRFSPLGNDKLDGPLTLLSVGDPSVLIEGRSLVLQEGFPASTFTCRVTNGTSFDTSSVTLVQGTAVVAQRVFTGLLYDSLNDVVDWCMISISTKGLASVQLRGGVETIPARVTFPSGAKTASTLSQFGNLTLVRNANNTLSVDLAALGGRLTGTLRAAQPVSLPGKHHIALASIDSAFPAAAA